MLRGPKYSPVERQRLLCFSKSANSMELMCNVLCDSFGAKGRGRTLTLNHVSGNALVLASLYWN